MTKNSMTHEVKITSFSSKANLYRFLKRKTVDKLFKKKGIMLSIADKHKNNKDVAKYNKYISLAKDFDKKARKYWREIITEANKY